jgi:DNA-binding IclR family transcriptional regulator
LKALTKQHGVDGHLSVWGEHGPTIIRIYNANSPIISNLRLGWTLPLLTSATGLVYLAHLEPQTTAAVLEKESRVANGAQPSAKDLKARLEEIRKDGYAWIDGAIIPGIVSIAAPIWDYQGELHGAISLVSGHKALPKSSSQPVQALLDTSKRISRELGWSGK